MARTPHPSPHRRPLCFPTISETCPSGEDATVPYTSAATSFRNCRASLIKAGISAFRSREADP